MQVIESLKLLIDKEIKKKESIEKSGISSSLIRWFHCSEKCYKG